MQKERMKRMSMLWGMLGAALALGLFGAGYWRGRRTARLSAGKRAAQGEPAADRTAAEWQEFWNFLHYDGGEMPTDKEPARTAGKGGCR